MRVFPTKITTITAAAADRAFKLIALLKQKVPVSSLGRSQKNLRCHFVKYSKTKSIVVALAFSRTHACILHGTEQTLTGHAKTT